MFMYGACTTCCDLASSNGKYKLQAVSSVALKALLANGEKLSTLSGVKAFIEACYLSLSCKTCSKYSTVHRFCPVYYLKRGWALVRITYKHANHKIIRNWGKGAYTEMDAYSGDYSICSPSHQLRSLTCISDENSPSDCPGPTAGL